MSFDYDKVCATLTDDAIYRIVGNKRIFPFLGCFVGKQAIREAMRLLDINFEYLDFEDTVCIVDRSDVAARWKSLWRNRGSGDSLEVEVFAHFVFDGYLIKEYTTFFDTASLLQLFD